MPASPARNADPAATLAQRLWRRFCRLQTFVFYRRREVHGLEHLPASGPVILCANHTNALADAVVVQAASPRPIHPIARSGLFRNPLLRPLLVAIQAVPIYRRQGPAGRPAEAKGDDAAASAETIRAQNAASFRRCYEILADGRVLLIFPEGQSHSDPMLRPLKTGAARLALGHRERTGSLPAIVPVGLVFTHKGRFRTGLLVQLGEPVTLAEEPAEDEEAVRRLTAAIEDGLEAVTINVESWQDLALLRRLQGFFELRRLRRDARRRRALATRVRVLQRLVDVHRWLRSRYPEEVARVSAELERFDRLCRRYGVEGYQLDLRYRPRHVARFLARALAFTVFVVPLALWGAVNSALPYLATRLASRRAARGRDQYDSAGMLFGIGFFLVAWTVQTVLVGERWGVRWGIAYAVSLPLTGAVALAIGRERRWLQENARVFVLFLRKRRLRSYLRERRGALEVEIARLAQLARHRLRESRAADGDTPAGG